MDFKKKLSEMKTSEGIEQYLQELLDEAYKEDLMKSLSDPAKKAIPENEDLLYYVQNMQNAIMPYSDLLPELFPHSFMYSISKETMSGDFCWIEQFEDKIFIATADCKTHGVKGAMMSIICASALNRVRHEFNICDTGKMLDKARELVLETFKNSDSGRQFGMNISLCCINKRTCVLEWSGANNNLFYVHHGIMEEMVGDKQPIGNHISPLPFTKHKMYLSKGDMIYLFTDGFANQVGGERGEKLMCKRFQEMLIKIAPLEARLQKEILQTKFEAWKEGQIQTDDVLVIGVRL